MAIPKTPEPAARVEVTQRIGAVEAGRVVGVDLGEVLGDVNIGKYNLTIGTLNGGVVNLASQEPRLPQHRRIPVMLLPRVTPGFLDRRDEVTAATAVLEGASPVEFHGPAGVGKSALLRQLAHHKFAPIFPDGIVFLSEIRHRPVEDLLLALFDAFYERDPTYIPTPVQVRHALQDERALIVLDDVDLARDEVEALMDAAPGSVFLLASTECCLWGQGRAVSLRGLPPEFGLALVERELGRALSAEDRASAEVLCAALEGHPLRLLQLAALVRDSGRSVAEIAARVQRYAGSAADALAELVLAGSPEPERRVLSALAVPAGASLKAQRVSALAGLADARPELDSLQRRGLIEEGDRGYTLVGPVGEELRRSHDLSPWANRALDHFATFAERHLQDLEALAEEADSTLRILEWGAQAGNWAGVLRLGRAMEGALAVSGQWGSWERVLGWELDAARALGDRAAEGWSLHQLGTRALCLEDAFVARENLTEALDLRESLGDREGAAVTRHNLRLLGGSGGDHGPEENGSGGGAGGLVTWLAIVGVIILLGILPFLGIAEGEQDLQDSSQLNTTTESGTSTERGTEAKPEHKKQPETQDQQRSGAERETGKVPRNGTEEETGTEEQREEKLPGDGQPGGEQPAGEKEPGNGTTGCPAGQEQGLGGECVQPCPVVDPRDPETGTCVSQPSPTCANNGIDDDGNGRIDEAGDCKPDEHTAVGCDQDGLDNDLDETVDEPGEPCESLTTPPSTTPPSTAPPSECIEEGGRLC
jgi:hypothetical protein